MKIMQINVVYKKGSTGKLVYEIHNAIQNHNSVVYYGRGKNYNEIDVHKIAPELIMKLQSLRSRITGYVYSGCYTSTKLLLSAISKEKPDVVHLHCINGYFVNIYKLLEYLNVNNIRTILTLHAEFMYTAGCGYSIDCEKWKTGCDNCPQFNKERPISWFFDKSKEEWNMMRKAYDGFNNLHIVSVSEWLHERASQSPFYKNINMSVIYNGVDTEIFKPTDFNNIKKRHRIEGQKVVLHVTPNFDIPIKGGLYVIELAKRFINENVLFIIVGVKKDNYDFPENVITLKHTQDQIELASYYSMADITLLTSKRETFSMVTAESLACGTPVIGFKAGAPETIALKKFSEFVEYGNIELLENSVRKWISRKEKSTEEISNEAHLKYSKETMVKKYLKLYEGES